MFYALATTLSLDDAYDLAEVDVVSRSWRDAAQANAEAAPQQQHKKRGRAR